MRNTSSSPVVVVAVITEPVVVVLVVIVQALLASLVVVALQPSLLWSWRRVLTGLFWERAVPPMLVGQIPSLVLSSPGPGVMVAETVAAVPTAVLEAETQRILAGVLVPTVREPRARVSMLVAVFLKVVLVVVVPERPAVLMATVRVAMVWLLRLREVLLCVAVAAVVVPTSVFLVLESVEMVAVATQEAVTLACLER
jgi:hypothetical protein